MKSTFAIIILFISNLAIGQIVYEKAVYSPDHPGDIELRDVILNIDSTDLINTGYYVHSQAVKYRDHGVLTSHHQSGNLQFAYDYAALDSLGKIMHMRFHSIVEDSLGGYIMVGTITKASNKHVSIPGAGGT